jgi:hypothetical protein
VLFEITTFRLVPGADEAAFLAADAAAQALAHHQPGLVRRTTGRGEGAGSYGVVSLWWSATEADAAAAALATDPVTEAFQAHVDAASVAVTRLETLD